MYNYLATIRHNDGTTGELVDLKRATFTSDTPIDEHDRENICEYMENLTEYEPDDGDVFRVDIVELADDFDDEDDDSDDEDDDEPTPPDRFGGFLRFNRKGVRV